MIYFRHFSCFFFTLVYLKFALEMIRWSRVRYEEARCRRSDSPSAMACSTSISAFATRSAIEILLVNREDPFILFTYTKHV